MTRTEITEYQSGLPSVNGEADPFLAYGQAQAFADGQFLSFKAGEWLYGMNQEVLVLGTKLAVSMPGMRVGWRRWENRQVVDDRTSLLTEMRQQPSRQSLGDTDEKMWDMLNGRPRDPWQMSSIVEMISGDGEKYIYATASYGGRKCLGDLCVQYAKQRRMRPGQLPLVSLGADSYDHKDYGKTWVPVLTITGWVDEETLEPVDDTPPLPPSKPLQAGAAAPATSTAAGLAVPDDDEPPFDVKTETKPARQAPQKPAEKRTPRF